LIIRLVLGQMPTKILQALAIPVVRRLELLRPLIGSFGAVELIAFFFRRSE
jgi:hypothetical protein